MSKSKSIDSLQVIRGVAALFVLLFHVSEIYAVKIDSSLNDSLFAFGVTGVDIFFVLSGFIIFYIGMNQRHILTSKDFILKRCMRILPLYWILFFIVIGCLILKKFGMPNQGETLGEIESGGMLSIIKSFFLIPSDHRTIYMAWTLSFEMSFYLLFGLLFFRKPKLFLAAFTLWVAACYFNFFFIHLDYSENLDQNPFRSLLDPVVTEFFFGCIAALIVLKTRPKFCMAALILGIIFYVFSAIGFATFDFVEKNKVMFFGFPSALIIYGAANIKTSMPKILTHLGDASYSIYLFHPYFFKIIIEIFSLLPVNQYINNYILLALSSILVTALCCLVHNHVEKPILTMCNYFLFNNKKKQNQLPLTDLSPVSQR